MCQTSSCYCFVWNWLSDRCKQRRSFRRRVEANENPPKWGGCYCINFHIWFFVPKVASKLFNQERLGFCGFRRGKEELCTNKQLDETFSFTNWFYTFDCRCYLRRDTSCFDLSTKINLRYIDMKDSIPYNVLLLSYMMFFG